MKPLLQPNNRLANILIITVSVIVLVAVMALDRLKVKPEWPFDMKVHVFATINACINFCVFILLIIAVIKVKQGKLVAHRNLMMVAMGLSLLFLISYILHHLFAGSTLYGGDGLLKIIYYILLITHIPLAGIILPFILYTAYRGLIGNYSAHKKLAKWTFPIWLYVALSGVLVYLMISPYYG